MNAQALAQRYRFGSATTDPAEIFGNPAINAVAVVTRHDSQAGMHTEPLRGGKSVYVEKPLVMNDGTTRFDHQCTWRPQIPWSYAVGRLQPALCFSQPASNGAHGRSSRLGR